MEPGYNFWVYIITNRTHTVLYTGMTNDLARRTGEHREGIGAGFPTAFRCRKLIYYEHYRNDRDAIAREKQLKNWSRAKKIALIRTLSPNWNDLGTDILQDP